jgi:hemolysin D
VNSETQPRAPLTLRVASALFEIETCEPGPASRAVLLTVCALVGLLIVWACVAKLDIVAVASGRLVPQTYVKVVQPAEAGIVRELLVEEGDAVEQGQLLVRLDSTVNAVDTTAAERELQLERLQLRRIESELLDEPLGKEPNDNLLLFAQIEAQRSSHRQAFVDSVAQETAARRRSLSELAAARESLVKLEATLPSYVEAAEAYEKLAAEQLVGTLEAIERRREAVEATQNVETQRATVASLEASIAEHDQRIAQVRSTYESELNQERLEVVAEVTRVEQHLGRLRFQASLLELRAPQGGVVKEMATSTIGAIVQPGTVLVTLVPNDEPLWAEVQVENQDIGFVAEGQAVRMKVAAYQFQKYGIAEGIVRTVSADSSESREASDSRARAPLSAPAFKALIELTYQSIEVNGLNLPFAAGMQVTAEIMQGERTVLEYLLSPVQRIADEAGRER